MIKWVTVPVCRKEQEASTAQKFISGTGLLLFSTLEQNA